MTRTWHGNWVRTRTHGSDFEAIRGLATVDAANGWPWDFGIVLLLYGFLRLIGLVLAPFRAAAARRQGVSWRS